LAFLKAYASGKGPGIDSERQLKSLITAIKAGKNPRRQRSNIYVDGKFAFSLDNELVLKAALKVGRELTAAEIEELNKKDGFQACLNASFRFLSSRPRSQAEIKERLSRSGYAIEEIERVLEKLKSLKLVDDTAFAAYWKDNRNSFKPLSQRMVKLELRRKGVESEVINETVGKIDENENAYRAAVVKARSLSRSDYRAFRDKLSGFLQRRGFDYGVSARTIKRLWEEINPNLQNEAQTIHEDSAGD
jgi:regulatory protein